MTKLDNFQYLIFTVLIFIIKKKPNSIKKVYSISSQYFIKSLKLNHIIHFSTFRKDTFDHNIVLKAGKISIAAYVLNLENLRKHLVTHCMRNRICAYLKLLCKS